MRYAELCQRIAKVPRTWLITGVAGFIGSNLLEALLLLDQRVIGLDNFATGHRRNLEEIERGVTAAQWTRFRFLEGDIRHSLADIAKAKRLLGYEPSHRIGEGLTEAMGWYVEHLK